MANERSPFVLAESAETDMEARPPTSLIAFGLSISEEILKIPLKFNRATVSGAPEMLIW